MSEADDLLDEGCPFCEQSAAPDMSDVYECAAPGVVDVEMWEHPDTGEEIEIVREFVCDDNCPAMFPDWGTWRSYVGNITHPCIGGPSWFYLVEQYPPKSQLMPVWWARDAVEVSP